MKPEKEFYWLVLLLESDYHKGLLKTKAGSKVDFERLLKAPRNSSEFHQWFNELLNEGCIKIYGEIPHPSNSRWMITGYVCDSENIRNRLYSLSVYKDISYYFNKDRII